MALLSLETPSAANWLAALPVSGLSLLYKHSPRCGVSFDAVDEVHAFAAAHPELPVWQLDVVRQRPLSQELSRELGIGHAPQQDHLPPAHHPHGAGRTGRRRAPGLTYPRCSAISARVLPSLSSRNAIHSSWSVSFAIRCGGVVKLAPRAASRVAAAWMSATR